MARPQKIKLDYFPLDCGFFQDERIIALRREHGALGIVTYIFLLTKVYDNGYYLKIPSLESFAQTIAENIASNREPTAKVAAHVVKAIRYMAETDLISKRHLKVNCITGVKIQEQYAKSKERYGGQALIKEFSLINGEHSSPIVLETETAINVTETAINVTETPINATEMPQSKINKSKEDKVSKKDINKDNFKDIPRARKSYQELMDSHEIPDLVQKALWKFIQHCQANGQIVTNDRLQSLWFKLKKLYPLSDVSGMVSAIRTAIDKGYYDIKDGEGWIAQSIKAARAAGITLPEDNDEEEGNED